MKIFILNLSRTLEKLNIVIYTQKVTYLEKPFGYTDMTPFNILSYLLEL